MKRFLPGLIIAIALALPAGAVEVTKNAPVPVVPAAPQKAAGDQAVLDDIERTLGELSGHISVGAKRLHVTPPGGVGQIEVPARIDLPVGKSRDIDLPGEAREVVVGDPTIADVAVSSRRRIFIMGRKAGRSNVFVMDGSGRVIARIDAVVGVDREAIEGALRAVLPDESIEVSAEGANVILSGTARSDAATGRAAAVARRFVEKDENVVNLVKVTREQQVLIEVRVTEVQRNLLKELGVTTGGQGGYAKFLSDFDLVGRTKAIGLSSTTFAGTFRFTGLHDLIVNLDLLESRGLVRNLAEPNLVAVSGETASMLAGGEYPIPVSDNDGIKIQYKPFGISLSFLPIVLDSGRISLKVSTEVSARSKADPVQIPLLTGVSTVDSFSVRRAATTVEMPNGGSLMIAGLLQNDILSGIGGVPFIMDVPILGALFRSESFRRNQTELVIMVTSTLVRPTAAANLAIPNDAVSPGGDLDSWLFGKLQGRYSPGFAQDGNRREVKPFPFGYIIDELTP
ncbi:MAG: type II and III secretion system protein family protein [Solirubrobacterales bacterium]